jgi:hypothetical protein
MPPECLVATRPAGAAPRPASRSPLETPLQRTRCAQFNAAAEAGDKLAAIFRFALMGRRGARGLAGLKRTNSKFVYAASGETTVVCR